jgi:lipoprotein-releasing system permease protein
LPVIRISIAAIALSIAVMVISDSILNGFKDAVTQKVMGFSSHLQIVSIDQNLSLEPKKLKISQDLIVYPKFYLSSWLWLRNWPKT